MPKLEQLLEDLNDLNSMVDGLLKPTPVQAPEVKVSGQRADLEAAAKQIKDVLPTVEEVIAGAEKSPVMKRFIWLAWNSLQALVSTLDGLTDEIRAHGEAVGTDVSGAVSAIEDLKKTLAPVQDAMDRLNSISKT
jgi:translation initiation factor IF-2